MRIEKLESLLEEKREILRFLNNEINSKKNERTKVQKEIAQIQSAIKIQSQNNNTGIDVSDHAMCRYIERCIGVNLTDIKSKILTEEVQHYISVMNGEGNFTINNIEYRVKNYVIITIINHP